MPFAMNGGNLRSEMALSPLREEFSPAKRSPPSPWHGVGASTAKWIWALAAAPLFALLIVPIFALTGRLSWPMLREQLNDPATLSALWLSLKTSSITTALAVFMGTPLAFIIAKRRYRLARILDVLIELPMVFPPLIVGIALLLTFGRRGLLGEHLSLWGIEIAFTQIAVVMAQLFVAAPFYIKTASIGMGALANELVDAAAADGADWLQFLRFVAIPTALPAVFCGAALCFSRALGEFGATMMFAGNIPGKTQTISLAVYLGFESDLEQAITLSIILLLTSLSVLAVTRLIMSRFHSDV